MKDKGLKRKSLEYEYWKKWFALIDLLYKKRELRFNKNANLSKESRNRESSSKIEGEIKNAYKEIENIEKEAKKKGINLRLVKVKKKYHLSEEEELLLVALLKNDLEGGIKNTNSGVELLELIAEDNSEKLEKLSFFSANGNLIKKNLIAREFMGSPLRADYHLTEKAMFELIGWRGVKEKEWMEWQDEASGENSSDYLITFIKPSLKLKDVVLSPELLESITDVIAQIKGHRLIFEKWGFGKKINYGTGTTMLFYGPPGTGKTFTALAIAGELEKEIGIVRYENLQDYLVGMTEKNIARVFEEAEERKCILLFDEADALFSERSFRNMKYDNREVNLLLQYIEKFKGVIILTTNFLPILDWALERRISLKVQFTPPSFRERVEIFKKLIPEEAPIEGLDIEKLAGYELTGGQIKNVLLNAARRAVKMIEVRGKEVITMEDLEKAIERELKKKEDEDKKIGFGKSL
jgi:SpoVK/Ycf46/Vps4 family AAA+-type ATPase